MKMIPRNTGPRGVVIYGVLAAITVLGLLLATLQSSQVERRRMASSVVTNAVLRFRALGAAETAAVMIGAELKKGRPFHDWIVFEAGEGDAGPRLAKLLSRVAEVSAGNDQTFTTDLRVRVAREHFLVAPSMVNRGFDEREVKGYLQIEARCGKSGRTGRAVLRLPFKVASVVAPVVSKFSLFVPWAARHGSVGSGFNVCPNFIDGSPGFRSEPQPLVVYGGPVPPSQGGHPMTAPGFVYLGGGRIDLNVAAGSLGAGEDFFFCDIGNTARRPVSYISRNPPPFLRMAIPGPEGSGLRQRWSVLHTLHGFYTADRSASAIGLETEEAYWSWFSRGGTSRASMLRLFGSVEKRSPAEIFGEVYGRFCILSALGVDIDQGTADEDARGTAGNDVDAIAGILPMSSREEYENRALRDDPAKPFRSFPPTLRNLNDSSNPEYSQIRVDTQMICFASIFGEFEEYARHMSRVVEGYSYRGLLGCMAYPAALPAWPPGPDPGNSFELKRPGSEGPYFAGSLQTIDLSHVVSKVQKTVPDQAGFEGAFIRDGDLRLGCVALVKSGNLALPEDLEIRSGGMVIVRGDIRVRGLISSSETPLTLVSLGGSILFEAGRPTHAGLVALAEGGRVAPFQRGPASSMPAEIKGHVASSTLNPAEWSCGGGIEYDPRHDPVGRASGENLCFKLSGGWDEVELGGER